MAVHRGVKFTCHFTLMELTDRWNALLYDPIISKLALSAVKNLHPEVVLAVERRTLFSKEEHDLVAGVAKGSANPPPPVEEFAALLQKHPSAFHPARTAR